MLKFIMRRSIKIIRDKGTDTDTDMDTGMDMDMDTDTVKRSRNKNDQITSILIKIKEHFSKD